MLEAGFKQFLTAIVQLIDGDYAIEQYLIFGCAFGAAMV